LSFQEFHLDPAILSGIKAIGYTTPTPIQQRAIPAVLEGKDLLGLAQTGTGKTAAFVLPILHWLNRESGSRQIRALIVAPTRELAEQIHQATTVLGRNTRVGSVAIYGGVSKVPQLKALRRFPGIVVACPGRLLDLVNEGAIDLSRVQVLVLDEADTMCDMGFLPDVRRILSHLPTKRQTLLFSATMPADISKLALNILKNPTRVQVDPIAPAKTVSHALYPVPDDLKRDLLLALLEQTPTGRALVFTRTKHRTRRLALDLAKYNYRVSSLQGNLSQNRRQQAMDGFRAGKFDILVATDIAAHGIDVPEISHVINFDMPDTVDAYTHRIGRTGRAHLTGEAFTLAVPSDEPMVRQVEKVLNARIERRRLPGFGYGDFNPETQFPQRRPDQPHRDGRRSGNNSSNHGPTSGQKMRQAGPAAKNSSGRPSITRGTRSEVRRGPSGRRG
jgi:ATP-dependent RNA helicase RhlE